MSPARRTRNPKRPTEKIPAPRPPADGVSQLTALIVGTDDWAIEQSAATLRASGHEVLTCHEPGEAAFPCNALIPGRRCPLDLGFDVVVTARARPAATPAMSEFGAICALHVGAPLVVTGIAERHPFDQWAARVVTERGDVVGVCEEVAAERKPRVITLPPEGSR